MSLMDAEPRRPTVPVFLNGCVETHLHDILNIASALTCIDPVVAFGRKDNIMCGMGTAIHTLAELALVHHNYPGRMEAMQNLWMRMDKAVSEDLEIIRTGYDIRMTELREEMQAISEEAKARGYPLRPEQLPPLRTEEQPPKPVED